MKAGHKRAGRILFALSLLALTGVCLSIGMQLRQSHLDHALLTAIKKQEAQKAIELLDQGASANAEDREDRSSRLHAYLADFWAKIRGKAVRKNDTYHASALVILCMTRSKGARWEDPDNVNLSLLRTLLGHGADPNAANSTGQTPLCLEISSQNVNAVRILLEHGADPNARVIYRRLGDQWDSTPLLDSVMRDMNLKIEATHQTGRTEQSLLISATHLIGITRLLLEHGADVNRGNSDGETPLMYAGDVPMLKLLLSYHSNVNAQDRSGLTPLIHAADHCAMFRQDPEILRTLLENGAEVSLKDDNGRTVLDHTRLWTSDTPVTRAARRLLTDAAKHASAQRR
jgi:ankyrin repeat protein